VINSYVRTFGRATRVCLLDGGSSNWLAAPDDKIRLDEHCREDRRRGELVWGIRDTASALVEVEEVVAALVVLAVVPVVQDEGVLEVTELVLEVDDEPEYVSGSLYSSTLEKPESTTHRFPEESDARPPG
jgi:hypothetical protein